jgi:hypothetical protein
VPKTGVLGVNQRWTEQPYRCITREQARFGERTRRYRRVKPNLVQELAPPITDGELGVGNAIPFSRVSNPIIAPSKLHYEIPRAGDRGIAARHRRPLLHPSGRVAKEITAIEWLSGSIPKSKDLKLCQ